MNGDVNANSSQISQRTVALLLEINEEILSQIGMYFIVKRYCAGLAIRQNETNIVMTFFPKKIHLLLEKKIFHSYVISWISIFFP